MHVHVGQPTKEQSVNGQLLPLFDEQNKLYDNDRRIFQLKGTLWYILWDVGSNVSNVLAFINSAGFMKSI
jgi:hypothetical protein